MTEKRIGGTATARKRPCSGCGEERHMLIDTTSGRHLCPTCASGIVAAYPSSRSTQETKP